MEKEIAFLLQDKYGGIETPAFKKDIKRLKAGEPLDHVIGFVEFLGCKILVDTNVLIPRPETEFWVESVINDKPTNLSLSVCDMFAGSGAIGIAVLSHVKNSQVTFVDSENAACAQIKKNCTLNKIQKNKYEIIQSDVFENITGQFDYIFANPPYIPNNQETRNKIQKSVIDYEPHVALFGGKDGLRYIRKFLALAKNFLTPGGRICMEFDTPQKNAIQQLLKKYQYASWEFHKDQYGKYRWVVIQ